MDSKLLKAVLSDARGVEQEEGSAPPFSYAEQFHQVFPYYLSIGMTEEQFWDGDNHLVKDYRRAEEIRNEKKNQELWLQGMYIYEALCDVAPIIRAFAKKGTKPGKYPTEPYAITKKEQKKKQENQDKIAFDKGLAKMEVLAMRMNRKFNSNVEKEVSKDADNS